MGVDQARSWHHLDVLCSHDLHQLTPTTCRPTSEVVLNTGRGGIASVVVAAFCLFSDGSLLL